MNIKADPVRTEREMIGMAIRDWRIEKRWSQGELARQLGVTQGIVSMMEHGHRMSSQTLIKICKLGFEFPKGDELNGKSKKVHRPGGPWDRPNNDQ